MLRSIPCKQCRKPFQPSAPKFVRCGPCRQVNRTKRGAPTDSPPVLPKVRDNDPERRQYASPVTDARDRAMKLARTAHKGWQQFKSAGEAQQHINALMWFAECAQSGFIPSIEWQLHRIGFIVARP